MTGEKWLPVIRTDECTGCGRCVQACPSGALDLVWSFATLVRPDVCTSVGDCVLACRDHLIRMDWVESAGDRSAGRWRDPVEVLRGVLAGLVGQESTPLLAEAEEPGGPAAAIRETHPRAARILLMDLDGIEPREIAERLDLGLRLVRRILRDLEPVRGGFA